ncbi:MAG: hypothetical protein ACM3PY_00520 [Omnitrophica WOR_2 bacterium]
MNRSGNGPCILTGAIVFLLGSFCICIGLVVALIAYGRMSPNITSILSGFVSTPAHTPPVTQPTIEAAPSNTEAVPAATQEIVTPGTRTATLAPTLTATPPMTFTETASRPVFAPVPTDTLRLLENSDVPIADPLSLASRLQDKQNIPLTLTPPPAPLQAGDQQKFWASNTETNHNFQVDATLQYITPHLYFWVQNGVLYNSSDLRRLADTFENKIYPTDREFFGSEWTPGIDDDVHIYILFTRGLGTPTAGFFSSADEYPPEVHPYSNAHEMFYINADNQDLGNDEVYGTLAHEFQHMIHWYRDRNETTWMNEGFSMLAEFLNHYPTYFDRVYADNPDVQLNDWSSDSKDNYSHYGESFLFLDYFLDRFKETATKALVGDPLNGLESIDHVLKETGAVDPSTHQPVNADDVFRDWTVASYLQDGTVGDGRYTYHNYPDAPGPAATEKISLCPLAAQTRDVHQYGVDYIRITCPGDYTLHFEGATKVGVVPETPHSGVYYFWSNKGDNSDMTLTKSFDFTGHHGTLTFSYWTWFDIEKDYDYLYLEASTDGEHWQIIKTPSGTNRNLSGNSYGWAYTGESGSGPDWIQEKVDLSAFAGKRVQLRFEYVTDDSVNGEGFLLDDLSIPELGYTADFEKDNGGWEGQGFVRMDGFLPQTYELTLITKGQKTDVQRIQMHSGETADIPLQIGGEVNEAILVVSGSARFTRQLATYRFSTTP